MVDLITYASYAILLGVIAYLIYKIAETEKQIRQYDAKLQAQYPYKVDAPVATAPLGRTRAPAKKVAVKKPAAKKVAAKKTK